MRVIAPTLGRQFAGSLCILLVIRVNNHHWREQANSHPNPFQDRIISETHSSLLQRGSRGKGAAAPFPCTPNPRRTASASLRTTSPGPSRLTIPNTSSTITMSASLRSDCCSPSLRNAVRLPSGIDVHLHRNTHRGTEEGESEKEPRIARRSSHRRTQSARKIRGQLVRWPGHPPVLDLWPACNSELWKAMVPVCALLVVTRFLCLAEVRHGTAEFCDF